MKPLIKHLLPTTATLLSALMIIAPNSAVADTCPIVQSTTQIENWSANGVVKPGAPFIKAMYDPTIQAITCIYGDPNDFTSQFNLVSIFIADAPTGTNWHKQSNGINYLVCTESLDKCQFPVPAKLKVPATTNNNPPAPSPEKSNKSSKWWPF